MAGCSIWISCTSTLKVMKSSDISTIKIDIVIVRGISFQKQGFSANVLNRMIFSGNGKYLRRIRFLPGGKKIRAQKWLIQPKMANSARMLYLENRECYGSDFQLKMFRIYHFLLVFDIIYASEINPSGYISQKWLIQPECYISRTESAMGLFLAQNVQNISFPFSV